MPAQQAAAQADPAATPKGFDARQEEARVDRIWNMVWRDFAARYLQHDEAFIYIEGYSPRLPSSAGQSAREYQSSSAVVQVYKDAFGRDQERRMTKPLSEAEAAVKLLPKAEVGQYGYIHSVRIDQIVDGKTLLANDVWLVDAQAVKDERDAFMKEALDELNEDIRNQFKTRRERRKYARETKSRRDSEREAVNWIFKERLDTISRQNGRKFSSFTWKIVGYNTDKLIDNARWPAGAAAKKGLQVIIVGVDQEKKEVTAVPAAAIGNGLSELQFIDLIHAREFTKPQLVERVNEAKRATNNRNEVTAIVQAWLEGRAYEPPQAGKAGEAKDRPINDEVELAD